MRKTKKAYEEYLNGLYSDYETLMAWRYMYGTKGRLPYRLLRKGKYGTALRRYDKTAFEVGYGEWQP